MSDKIIGIAFLPGYVSQELFAKILSAGSQALEQSRKLDEYGISLREVFGLYVLVKFREFLDKKDKWAFTTEPAISDDGAVISLRDNREVAYSELIEQVFLPGNFLKRYENENLTDFILREIEGLKVKDRGFEYAKNKSLFILSDLSSVSISDSFQWTDFVLAFFSRDTFLHVYVLGLAGCSNKGNEYHFLSFSNQKHRQKLNGQFIFNLTTDGVSNFRCIQKMNLLEPKDNLIDRFR